MFQSEASVTVNADLEKVFEKATTYPTFVRFFLKGSKIIGNTDSHLNVEVHAKLLGLFKTKWLGEGVKTKNKSINFIQTEGFFKDLEAVWSFENLNPTTVKITTKFSKPALGRRFESFLGKRIVEKTTKKILKELKDACESDER